MAPEIARAITVRDYRRLEREIVLDSDSGKILRTKRATLGKVSGLAKRQGGEAVAVYKRSDGSGGLVVRRGRTSIDLDHGVYEARVTRSLFGLRSRVLISDGETSLSASQWNFVAGVLGSLDPTWDGLDEDGEDFVGWLKRVVDDPAIRRRLLKVWSPVSRTD